MRFSYRYRYYFVPGRVRGIAIGVSVFLLSVDVSARISEPVMLKPRCQNIGPRQFGLELLASALRFCPRPRIKINIMLYFLAYSDHADCRRSL